ncbi:AAA family ATPase [Nitrospiraceae bacterium AH_259_D15_M11_P09]|nr:AAA family ATPase [Nitrospiraceae bacterium AH_259_D15_M11_P09]
MTVLFCDLVESTALAQQLGPEAMHTLLNQFFVLALTEVHRYAGTINQFLGDGFMALFGAPLAYEDHSDRAVRTALGIQHALVEGCLSQDYAGGHKVAVRIGVNTGPVVVGKIGDNLRMDYTAVGDTTHLAARLQELAEPGTIYLSDQTHRAIRHQFECQSMRARLPKSKGEPVTVYKVQGTRVHQQVAPWRWGREISAPLVGREAELGTLTACFERVARHQGGMVFLLGEPGIGKSRLVAEARRRVSEQGLSWLEGRAFSYSQTISYGPFLELIKSEAGITDQDREAESWAKLEQRITALCPDEVAEILPYLATLLALNVSAPFDSRVKYLNSEDMGRQIFRTSRHFFERLAQAHPLVLLFEDMHWADESSVKLLEHLLPLTKTLPLLICWVSRPELQESAVAVQNEAQEQYAARYTEITLGPLSSTESADLVCRLLQSERVSPRVQEVTVAKAGGNPFFMEEVVHTLIDTGALKRTQDATDWLATKQLDEITLPDTIQGVIMARVDRLQEDIKQVLKLASVIGRHFFYRVLRSLTEPVATLDPSLAILQHLDLIREKRRIPELEYFFKHALVQEATYDSILMNRRRDLHRQVAQCIEALYAARKEEFASLLAYHYARAEEWEKALDFLLKAGDQAGQLAADAEALAHYHQAMATYGRVHGDRWDPVQRAALERKIGEALFRRGEHRQAMECLYRALTYLGTPYPGSQQGLRWAILKQLLVQVAHRVWPALIQTQAADRPDAGAQERSLIYETMAWHDVFVDRQRFVLDTLLELNLSERQGLAVGIAQGSFTLGLVLNAISLRRLAEHYHRRNVAWSEQIQHPRALGHAYLGLGIHEHYSGRPQAALDHFRRAITAYKEAGHLRGMAATKARAGSVLGRLGAFPSAIEVAQEAIRIGRDGADPPSSVYGLALESWVRRDVGEIERAIRLHQQCIELSHTIPDYQHIAVNRANLGKCYLFQGKVHEALAEVEESHRIITEHGLIGVFFTDSILHAAEVTLVAAEQADGLQRANMLGQAKRACKAALKQSTIDRMARPSAYCWQGTYAWLCGKPSRAKKWWQRSVRAAEELGMRHKLGITYLEMGKRTREPHLLKRAEALFAELGATRDLARTQELLKLE